MECNIRQFAVHLQDTNSSTGFYKTGHVSTGNEDAFVVVTIKGK